MGEDGRGWGERMGWDRRSYEEREPTQTRSMLVVVVREKDRLLELYRNRDNSSTMTTVTWKHMVEWISIHR